MATISASDLETLRRKVMSTSGATVILAIPTATSDATSGVFLVKDPQAGDTPVTNAATRGNAKGGHVGGLSWKAFSYADLVTAYSL